MELNDFIKTALTEIVEGVRQSREGLRDDVVLCAHVAQYNDYPSVSYKDNGHERQAPLTVVGFKVQVQVGDGHTTDGGMKVGVLNVISCGTGDEVSHTSSTAQELTFSIPMVWKKKQ